MNRQSWLPRPRARLKTARSDSAAALRLNGAATVVGLVLMNAASDAARKAERYLAVGPLQHLNNGCGSAVHVGVQASNVDTPPRAESQPADRPRRRSTSTLYLRHELRRGSTALPVAPP